MHRFECVFGTYTSIYIHMAYIFGSFSDSTYTLQPLRALVCVCVFEYVTTRSQKKHIFFPCHSAARMCVCVCVWGKNGGRDASMQQVTCTAHVFACVSGVCAYTNEWIQPRTTHHVPEYNNNNNITRGAQHTTYKKTHTQFHMDIHHMQYMRGIHYTQIGGL